MNLHISIVAEKVGELFSIPLTNTLITTWTVTALLMILAVIVGRSVRLVPGKTQNALEGILEYILNFMEGVFERRDLALKFFPLVAGLFLFIFTSNVLEFIPGIGSIGFWHTVGGDTEFTPLLRSVNTDLNVTLALAVVSVIVTEVVGVAAFGFFQYAKKFFNFSSPLALFIGLFELVSTIVRLLAFSFRLFGNIFAGEVLILVLASFLPVFLPVPFMAFELFVGFIQASIFALLTLFFIKLSITPLEHAT